MQSPQIKDIVRPLWKHRDKLHVAGYTLILLIEMNIAYHYGASYWKTACLNASIFNGDEISGSKDYASIATFVNSMKDDIVEPNINESEMKFVPQRDTLDIVGQEENNHNMLCSKQTKSKILFALTGVIGLDKATLGHIMEHRPFKSLNDYVERMIDTKLISPKKSVTLVKAGMFDQLEGKNKRDIMIELVKHIVPEKDKVTMVQLPYVRDRLPQEFNKYLEVYDFRNKITGRNKVPMNKDIEKEFIDKYADDVEYDFKDGKLNIDIKDFNKYYNKYIEPLKEELKKEEYAKRFTQLKRQEFWLEECSGKPSEWEIETVQFNTEDFVINTDIVNENYELSNFDDLEDSPLKSVNDYGFKEYHISAITGVVVGANHMKRLVYLLTKDSGVVTVKLTRKQYPYYHEKLDNDPSWFERGNKLIVLGYKQGESFNARGNRIYRNPLIQIEEKNNRYLYKKQKG